MTIQKNKRVRRVLLAATVGLATLTLDGCGATTSGNLMAPPDTGPADAGTDAGTDAAADPNDAGPPDAP